MLVEVEPGAEVIPVGEQNGCANPGGRIAEERTDLRDDILVECVALLGTGEPEYSDGMFDLNADQIVAHPATLVRVARRYDGHRRAAVKRY